MRLVARVPATVANLGPGFDCLAMALDLVNEVWIDTDAEPHVTWEGEGAAELPTDGSDMISRTMSRVAESAGTRMPSLALRAVNRVPLERGLGSSAAACVAGITLAGAVLHLRLDASRRLAMAAAIENHPDNAAAVIHGGLTVAYGDGHAVRLTPSPQLRPAVLVPEHVRLPTSAARDALPASTSLADATFNLARTALAVVALTERPELLREALEDRLHQSRRLALVPQVASVFETIREAGIPICVSGAGPSLLAFESGEAAVPDLGPGWRVLRIPPRAAGAEVSET